MQALVLVEHELHQRAAAQHRHRLHRHAVRPHDDRGVADAAADDGVTRADLLGNVDAAFCDLEGDVETLGLEVAALLGDHERPERRQRRRRRQEIGDVFRRQPAP